MAYFSNSSEGEVLDEQCHDCPLGAGWNGSPDQRRMFDDDRPMRPCPVFFVQMEFNYKQLHDVNLRNKEKQEGDLIDAMNCLIDEGGICLVRKLLVEIRDGIV